MSVDDLETALRSGAERVDRGRFKIDPQKALAKLRDHRLANPHHYVLELLRAAAASEARVVEVRVDADDFELRFDGKTFPPTVVRDLLSHALTGGGDAEAVRARLLALGIAGSLGLQPKFVRLRSGTAGLELRPPNEVELLEEPNGPGTTHIHVRERLGWRVVRNKLLGPAEIGIIRQAAKCFPAKLTLNGDRIDGGSPFDFSVRIQTEANLGTTRIIAAVPRDFSATSTLTLDAFGTTIVTREVALPFLQMGVWARDDGFRRSASGSEVVEDDPRLRAVLKKLPALANLLLQRLIASLDIQSDDSVLGQLVQLTLEHAHGLAKLPADTRVLIEKAPLLPGPSGERVSIEALQAELNKGRPLRFARQRYLSGSYTQPAVLLERDESELLPLLPGAPDLDVGAEVQAREHAASNKRSWERGPVEAAQLPDGPYLARASLHANLIEGEVAFLDSPVSSRVRLLCLNKLLDVGNLHELEPLRVTAVVNLQHPLREKAWAQPSNAATAEVLLAVREAAGLALTDALEQTPTPSVRLRKHGRDFITHMLGHEGAQASDLPAPLKSADLYELAGGEWASFERLIAQPWLRFIQSPWKLAALSQLPIAVLNATERLALGRIVGKEKLLDCSELLSQELEIRDRLARSHVEPRVVGSGAARIEINADGITGEIALPLTATSQLDVTLLRNGFLLERFNLKARYAVGVAVVDCPELTPADDWKHAKRDKTYVRVIAAIRQAERSLLGPVLQCSEGKPLGELDPGPAKYLTAFLKKELAASTAAALDALQRSLREALLFRGSHGPLSLAQIADAAQRTGHLWIAEPATLEAPDEMVIVTELGWIASLVAELVGKVPSDARAEANRLRARARFLKQEVRSFALPPSTTLQVELELPELRARVGVDATAAAAGAELRYQGRFVGYLPSNTPLPVRFVVELRDALFDAGESQLSDAARDSVANALALTQILLIERALDGRGEPGASELLLAVLAARVETKLSRARAKELLGLPLFPTTAETWISAEALDALPTVRYVTEAIVGAPMSGEPAVLCENEAVLLGLTRWKSTLDATGSLRAELAARQRHQGRPKVARIALSCPTLRRKPFHSDGVEGEVGLVPPGRGRLELFHTHRALCEFFEPALPSVAAVAANCDALSLGADATAVAHDKVYQRVLNACRDALIELAKEVGAAWASLPIAETASLRPILAQLGLWLLATRHAPPELTALPLLETTSVKPLSLNDLMGEQARAHAIRSSMRIGALLDAEQWVWRPRPGEAELLGGSWITLKDATSALEHAEEVRGRPRVSSLSSPLASAWRQPVGGAGIEGEVAVWPTEPTGKLKIELLRDRVLLERVEVDHAIGGVARVNCDELRPNGPWNKATRNKTFRRVRDEVERALEQLVARLLKDGAAELGWLRYAKAAVHWRLGKPGPLGDELPRLALFKDLQQRPVTLGRVLAEVSRAGRVAVADGDAPPPDDPSSLVISGEGGFLRLLTELELRFEDITPDLRRRRDIEASRRTRKLETLAFPGAALLRLTVDTGGLRGELALPMEASDGGEITLCRSGVEIERYVVGGLDVAGAIDHADLQVDAEWTKASPSPALRRALREQIDRLFGQLAASSGELSAAAAAVAARHALRYLANAGMTAAEHLDRMAPPASDLATLKLFPTCDGRRVDLRAIANRIVHHGDVPLLDASLTLAETRGDLVLATRGSEAGWIEALEAVVGRRCLSRPTDADAWRLARAEEDPEEGSPLAMGLSRLRHEAKLLKAEAFGRLGPAELKQISLHRGDGTVPLSYDAERRMVTLDPEHALIRRALEEATLRPERIYVLLAAIYSAVHRTLDRVTDEDEARLAGALLAHLAANPRLLDVSTERTHPKEPEDTAS